MANGPMDAGCRRRGRALKARGLGGRLHASRWRAVGLLRSRSPPFPAPPEFRVLLVATAGPGSVMPSVRLELFLMALLTSTLGSFALSLSPLNPANSAPFARSGWQHSKGFGPSPCLVSRRRPARVRCLSEDCDPASRDWRQSARPVSNGRYPARQHCSQCGLCDSYFVAKVLICCTLRWYAICERS
jgi:hypothetical protein